MFGINSDLDRIQTYNLLSRNQMRYSVAPRGRFAGANIYILLLLRKENKLFYFVISDLKVSTIGSAFSR